MFWTISLNVAILSSHEQPRFFFVGWIFIWVTLIVTEEVVANEETFNAMNFFSFFLTSSSLVFSLRISYSCSLSLPKRVVIPRALRFWDSFIAVTLDYQSLVIHLNTLLIQSWFEISFPKFCNLLTMWSLA